MSSSESTWCADLPERWTSRRLKYLTTCNDEVLAETTADDHEIQYVDIGSVSGLGVIEKTEVMPFGSAPSRARRVVRSGDVLVSTVRTYLKAIAAVKEAPSNLVASTGFAVIRCDDQAAPGYMSYALRTEGFVGEVIARSVGVSYPAINSSDLIGLSIPAPSLEEQTQIAKFLDYETAKIDALIDKQQQLIALLKEKRQAVISHAVTKGLNPDAPMKDSGVKWLGDVPAHWETPALKHVVATPITDGPHETPEFLDEGVPFVSAEAVSTGVLNFERIRGFISEDADRRYSKKYSPKRGDIYMVKSGATTGVTAIVETDRKFNIWSPLAVIRCGQNCDPYFILFFMRSREFLEAVELNWSFGTQQNIGMGVIENLRVACPPRKEAEAIAQHLKDKLGSVESVLIRASKQIELLQERRTALISAAVTGKIDVRNWKAPESDKEVA